MHSDSLSRPDYVVDEVVVVTVNKHSLSVAQGLVCRRVEANNVVLYFGLIAYDDQSMSRGGTADAVF